MVDDSLRVVSKTRKHGTHLSPLSSGAAAARAAETHDFRPVAIAADSVFNSSSPSLPPFQPLVLSGESTIEQLLCCELQQSIHPGSTKRGHKARGCLPGWAPLAVPRWAQSCRR